MSDMREFDLGDNQVEEETQASRLHVTIFDTLCGIEVGIGAAQVAEAVLASDWLRDRDAAKWEEGVNAHSNSSSIFTRDTLAKNPYRSK